jgi:8-hydroxy-5-deazaflavin:NADPH oxidoreductase
MALPKVAIIGSGIVGQTLANGFLKYGYGVIRASRDPDKLSDWLASAEPKDLASTGTFEEAAASGDLIVLAVPGAAAVSALEMCGVDNLNGKVVIDTTNPIGGPPVDGVLTFFAGASDSLMETLQEKFPDALFVKAFSCVGNAHMVDPSFDLKPTMFICGNDSDAKTQVSGILDKFGWEVEDMGGVRSARAIEPLCQLWCIPIFGGSKGDYAFKLLKK